MGVDSRNKEHISRTCSSSWWVFGLILSRTVFQIWRDAIIPSFNELRSFLGSQHSMIIDQWIKFKKLSYPGSIGHALFDGGLASLPKKMYVLRSRNLLSVHIPGPLGQFLAHQFVLRPIQQQMRIRVGVSASNKNTFTKYSTIIKNGNLEKSTQLKTGFEVEKTILKSKLI